MGLRKGWDSKVVASVREKQLAILFGAGISIPSGIPSANSIGTYIIESLLGKQNDLAKKLNGIYLTLNFPFEALMDTLATVSDITPLLDIFKLGKPNTYHTFISELAARGYLKVVITPNFDELLEESLRQYNVDFKQICDYNESDRFSNNFSNDPLLLYKIHGTVSNPVGIVTTLKSLTEKKLYKPRLQLLSCLLTTGSYKHILGLGYSGSDELDVNTVLQGTYSFEKEFTLIKHSHNANFSESGLVYPFDKFTGISVMGKTENAVSTIWSQLAEIIGEPPEFSIEGMESRWQEIIDEWVNSLKQEKIKYIKQIIAAALTNYSLDMDGAYTGSGSNQPRSRIVRTYNTLGHAYMMSHCPKTGSATLLEGANMAHSIGDFPHEWWMYYRLSFYSKIGKQFGAHAYCAKKNARFIRSS